MAEDTKRPVELNDETLDDVAGGGYLSNGWSDDYTDCQYYWYARNTDSYYKSLGVDEVTVCDRSDSACKAKGCTYA